MSATLALSLLSEVKAALQETLAETVDARPSRRQRAAAHHEDKKVSCTACRFRKIQCFGEVGFPCVRCTEKNLDCTFPPRARPGPKVTNAKTTRLQKALKQVEEALALISEGSHGATTPQQLPRRGSTSASVSSTTSSRIKNTGGIDVERILENPLELLSQRASLDHEADIAAKLPSEVAVEQYYSAGLYEPVSDANQAFDPIFLGLLTASDFDRLLSIYYRELHTFLWLLTPDLHSAAFIRSVSPFLTTAVAATVAHFCPFSGHLVEALDRHARYLTSRVLLENLKSIEISQAFMFLAHWLSPSSSCARDMSWSLTGFAIRMFQELRLDRSLESSTVEEYAQLAALPADAPSLLARDREVTGGVIFCLHLCLPVLTGRMPAVPGSASIPDMQLLPPTLHYDDFDYNRVANLTLNTYFAKALNLAAGLQAEDGVADPDLRDAFTAAWTADLNTWATNWPRINYFIQVHSLNLRIILLSTSLKFDGPAEQVLGECKSEAVKTLRIVDEWLEADHSILYASNYVVVDIAYSAVLLLNFIDIEEPTRGEEADWSESKAACGRVALALEQIGRARLHGTSLATLHAARIRTLLRHLDRKAATADAEAPPVNLPDPLEHDSGPVTDFLEWFITDPMLGFEWEESTGVPGVVGFEPAHE